VWSLYARIVLYNPRKTATGRLPKPREEELKASKPGWSHQQVYTVTYSATDASGNSSTAVAQVQVPHSRSRKERQLQATSPTP
jgi:hypothetical protein